jgi:hypothetical protein
MNKSRRMSTPENDEKGINNFHEKPKEKNHLNVISVGGTIIVKDVKETVWVGVG